MAAKISRKRHPFSVASVILLAASLLGAAGYSAQGLIDLPVEVRIPLETLTAEEIRTLVQLHRELDTEANWLPPEICSKKTADVLATHIGHNRTVRRWNDLLRAGDQAGLGILNSAIQLLSQSSSDAELERLRVLPREELAKEILTELKNASRRSHESYTREILRSDRFEGVVLNTGTPCIPTYNGWHRTVRACWGKSTSTRNQWEDAYVLALNEQKVRLADLHQWYERLGGTSELELSSARELKLVLVRRNYSDPSLTPYRWKGEKSQIDWAVLMRYGSPVMSQNPAQQIEYDTGIRAQELQARISSEGAVAAVWPPLFCCVDTSSFEGYLQSRGLPAGFKVHQPVVVCEGTEADPQFRVNFSLTSLQFRDWREPASVVIRAEAEVTQSSVVAELVKTCRLSLENHVPRSTEINGVPAKWKPVHGHTNMWSMNVSPRDGPVVTLRASLNEQAILQYHGVETPADSNTILAWMAEQQPELRGAKHSLMLQSVELTPEGKLQGFLVALSSGKNQPSLPPVAWTPREDGMPALALNEDWNTWSKSLPPAPEPVKTVDRPQDIRQALIDAVQSEFPKVATATTLDEAAGQNGYTLGLRVNEWPLIQLGPIQLERAADAVGVVKTLLAEESVLSAASTQWQSPKPNDTSAAAPLIVNHPRYGKVEPKLKRWNAETGEASVGVRAKLWIAHTQDLNMDWEESSIFNSARGIWNVESPTSQQIARQSPLLIQKINEVSRSVFGNALKFEAETGRLGEEEWLTILPPSVRLRASIRLPWELSSTPNPNGSSSLLAVDVRDIRIDHQGIHFPKGIGATWRGTFSTPLHVAISDPRVSLGFDENRLVITLGCKLTPSLLPFSGPADYGIDPSRIPGGLRLDNLWLHVVYADVSMSGRITDPMFRLEGLVRVLERADVARAELNLVIPTKNQKGSVSGRAIAMLPKIGDLPPIKVNGSLLFDEEGLKLNGSLDLLRLANTRAAFVYHRKSQPAMLTLQAQARLQIFRSLGVDAVLDGHTDTSFRDYRLTGSAPFTIPTLIGSRKGEVIAYLTPSSYDLDIRWVENDQVSSRRFSVPSPDKLDLVKLERDLTKAIEQNRDQPAPLTTAEESKYIALLNQARESLPNGLKASASEPVAARNAPVPIVKNSGGPAFAYVYRLIPTDFPGSQNREEYLNNPAVDKLRFIYFRSEADAKASRNPMDGLFLTKAAVGLDHIGKLRNWNNNEGITPGPDNDKLNFRLWPDGTSDGTGSACILIFDHSREELKFIRAKSLGKTKNITPKSPKDFELKVITSEFSQVKPMFTGNVSEDQKLRLELGQQTAIEFARALAYGYETGKPEPFGDGYMFKATVKNPAIEDAIFTGTHQTIVWTNSEKRYTARILDGAIPDSVSPIDLASAITGGKLTHDLGALPRSADPRERWVTWIVAWDGKPDGRLAMLEGWSTRPLNLKLSRNSPAIPLQFTTANGEADAQLGLLASRIARAVWSLGIRESNILSIISGELGCLIHTNEGYWIMPSPGAFSGADRRAVLLKESRFKAWDQASAELLPPTFRTPEQRGRITAMDLAKHIFANWDAARAADPDTSTGEARKAIIANKEWASSWGANPLGMVLGLAEDTPLK